jgi:hypothetical protein
MKRKTIVVLGLLVTTSLLLVTTASAQEPTPTPTPGINPSSIAVGFGDPSFWVALLATVIAGALGGVVYELLILQGNIELPHKLTDEEVAEKPQYAIGKYMFDLGIWARVIIGALAAIAALLVLSPSTAFELLATAVIAGSAGTAIFRSMQDRLLAAIALKDAADTKAQAEKQNAKIEEAAGAFTDLKNKLVAASTSPAGTRSMVLQVGTGTMTLDPEDLDRVEKLLSEATGIHEGMA